MHKSGSRYTKSNSGSNYEQHGPDGTAERDGVMKRIEAVIKPYKLEEVQDALGEAGINGTTVYEVMGLGQQRELTETRGGASYSVDFLPKLKIDLVVADQSAERAVNAIIKSARTGKIGDGKVFVSLVEQAVRIRTEEKGDSAV